MAIQLDNQIKPVGSTVAKLSNSNTTITVTCNDGYTFVDAPTMSYTTSWGEEVQDYPLTLSADKKSASDSYKLSVYDPNGDAILIKGNTVSEGGTTPTPPTVNNHVANTTVNTSYTDGKLTITITSTKNARYYRLFNVKASYTENGTPKTVDFNISVTENNACIATATFDVGSGITIDVTGDNEEVISVEKTLNNCMGDIPDYYRQGATVDITLTANAGTEFQECQLLYDAGGYEEEIANAVTISSDKKTATIHYVLTDTEKEGISIYGNCVVVAPVGGNYGAINVYVVTDDNLTDFSKVRFESTSNGEVQYYDLGKYVNRIKRIFANVENGATDILKCANYNTNIEVHQPKSDKLTLDFGTVTITDHNKDNTDYESNIQLFVPFTGLVSIPNEYIGKEIHLYIDINVITGGGLYRLLCDDIQFQTGECTPSIDVLYRTADANQIGSDTWNENLFMGLEPYIILKWYESKNTNGRNNDFKQGVISSFTGFNSFTDITPISTQNMLANEQQMIYNILQTGVYIE
jgi:hypothetical protein